MVDGNSHAVGLGKIVATLHSLETSLRVAIGNLDATKKLAVNLRTLKVGDRVKIDAFTSYDALPKLLGQFNALVPAADRINAGPVIAVRDALAHGRVLSAEDTPNFPLMLLKFGQEDKATGEVVAEVYEAMTDAWFAEKFALVDEALKKAVKHFT